MNNEHIFVVIYLIGVLLLSIPLSTIIYKSIVQKPLAHQTLIDLLSRDCIIYNYFSNFWFSLAIIGCSCSYTHTLDFVFALIISNLWYFSICLISLSLSLAGLLRLRMLVNNSLDDGIHFFGQDNQAICVVRLLSTIISLFFLFTMTLFLQIFPGVFYVFYIDQNLTIADVDRNTPYTIVLMIPPVIATVINIICKLYALHLSNKMQEEKHSENATMKFDLSIGGTILISSQLFAVLISSVFQRSHRLFVIFPCMITSNVVLIPLYIIFTNEKIEKMLIESLTYYLIDGKQFLLSCLRKSAVVTPYKSTL